METKKSTKTICAKLHYEAPILRSMEIELEYGIANSSYGTAKGNEAPQGRWNDVQTQSSEATGVW